MASALVKKFQSQITKNLQDSVIGKTKIQKMFFVFWSYYGHPLL